MVFGFCWNSSKGMASLMAICHAQVRGQVVREVGMIAYGVIGGMDGEKRDLDGKDSICRRRIAVIGVLGRISPGRTSIKIRLPFSGRTWFWTYWTRRSNSFRYVTSMRDSTSTLLYFSNASLCVRARSFKEATLDQPIFIFGGG